MRVLLTGGAGFIGMHLTQSLVEKGHGVTIVDNLNDYYTPRLKVDRLAELGVTWNEGQHSCVSSKYPGLSFFKGDIVDKPFVLGIFEQFRPELVINLAAQAGGR